jgi:hypothetical protein
MTRRTSLIALLFGLVAVLVGGLTLAPPVLLRWQERGAVDPGDVMLVIMNPLRDREREKGAESLLEELRDGQCKAALAFIDADRAIDYCLSEAEAPLESWNVINRTDSRMGSQIHYQVLRKGYDSATGNVWVTVAQRGSEWMPTDYESWY